MTQDEIIKLAREAELIGIAEKQWYCIEELERFAALVAEATKERCAKVCEAEAESWNEFDEACYEASASKRCAATIRSMK